MIDAIIFDYGGVFTKEGSIGEFFSSYAEKEGLDSGEMKAMAVDLWAKARVSEIDSNKFWVDLANFSNKEVIDFKKEIDLLFGFRNELYEYVSKNLKGKYKLGLLSNHIESWLGDNLTEKGLGELFDVIVTSYESKIAKPDVRIFNKIIEKLGSKPHECIYIDDRDKNIIQARKMNMKTIKFKSFKQFKGEIEKLIT